ncbi:hypothetical protein MTO96_037156 [Rhipicephalus appendiculatus]
MVVVEKSQVEDGGGGYSRGYGGLRYGSHGYGVGGHGYGSLGYGELDGRSVSGVSVGSGVALLSGSPAFAKAEAGPALVVRMVPP